MSDDSLWFHPPPRPAARRCRLRDRSRRPSKSSSTVRRPLCRPPGRSWRHADPWGSTRQRSATWRTSRRSTSAGSAWSNWRAPHAGAGVLSARRAGMEIRTDSPRVQLSRKMVIEFLASSVDLSTAPQAQAYAARYGACPERYGQPQAPSGPGGTRRPRAGPSSPARRDRRGDSRAAGEGG